MRPILARLSLALLLLLAPSGWSAVAYNSGGSRTTLTGDITVPSGSNRMLIVYVGNEHSGTSPTHTVALNGTSLTEVTGSPATSVSGSGNDLRAYYLLEVSFPSTGAQPLVVTENDGSGRLIGWMFFEGVAQSAPSYSEVNSLTSATEVTLGSLSAVADGAISAALMEGGTGILWSPTGGWTEVWDAEGASGDAHGASAYKLTAAGTESITFSRASGVANRACGIALILSPSGGGGPTSPPSGILLRGGGR